MHHLSPLSEERLSLSSLSEGCQALVRFFALLRIKPHAPLLVRVPVNSFEFHGTELLRAQHLVLIVYGVDYQGI